MTTPLGNDDDAARWADTRRLREGWIGWLKTIRWAYAVDVTFTTPVAQAQVRRAVRRWLRTLGTEVYGVVIPAVGKGGRLHGHVLVGGVARTPVVEGAMVKAWGQGRIRGRGRITVKPYTPKPGPRGGVVRYRIDDQDHDPADITLIGTPLPYKPRPRGRRGKGGHHSGRKQP